MTDFTTTKSKHTRGTAKLDRRPIPVHESEQLYLIPGTPSRKSSKLAQKPSVGSCSQEEDLERTQLEKKYNDRLQLRLDFRRLVTYVPNKKLPVYNWFKFKEGFSRELVFRLLNELAVEPGEIVLDPFAGCGTSLLACKEFNYPAVGMDILPIAAYVASTKLLDWEDLDLLIAAVDRLMSSQKRKPSTSFPEVKIVNLAFPKEVQQDILFYKEEVLKFDPPVRDFLMLGLLSILEQVSFTSKDGQFLRLVERRIPPVKDALRRQLTLMISDLGYQQQALFKSGKTKVEVFKGDARELCLPERYWGKVAAVITSPPYLNRYDYSRTYSLELCVLSVETFRDLRNIRHSLLRSHIESREHQGKRITLPALDEILLALSHKPLNNERIPVMVKGYFEDMNLVIKNLAMYLKPGGSVALVVANAQFEGESVPTDLMLSELAETHGFDTDKIWITRYKGNSSQQMAKFGRRPVRETIVFWRKTLGRKTEEKPSGPDRMRKQIDSDGQVRKVYNLADILEDQGKKQEFLKELFRFIIRVEP